MYFQNSKLPVLNETGMWDVAVRVSRDRTKLHIVPARGGGCVQLPMNLSQ